jgi:hypothetical protein
MSGLSSESSSEAKGFIPFSKECGNKWRQETDAQRLKIMTKISNGISPRVFYRCRDHQQDVLSSDGCTRTAISNTSASITKEESQSRIDIHSSNRSSTSSALSSSSSSYAQSMRRTKRRLQEARKLVKIQEKRKKISDFHEKYSTFIKESFLS